MKLVDYTSQLDQIMLPDNFVYVLVYVISDVIVELFIQQHAVVTIWIIRKFTGAPNSSSLLQPVEMHEQKELERNELLTPNE